MDILYIAATVVLAALIHGLVLACEKLGGRA
jgi:FlaG/FlaF family flagellin (archaellin)